MRLARIRGQLRVVLYLGMERGGKQPGAETPPGRHDKQRPRARAPLAGCGGEHSALTLAGGRRRCFYVFKIAPLEVGAGWLVGGHRAPLCMPRPKFDLRVRVRWGANEKGAVVMVI